MEHTQLTYKTNVPYIDYYTPFQLILPTEYVETIDESCDVIKFNEVLNNIGVQKYLVSNRDKDGRGRKGYNPVNLLKVILYGFTKGYTSYRELANLCKYDLRFIYLLKNNPNKPSHQTFCNFVKEYLTTNIENIFIEINKYINSTLNIDTNHIYIDGTKIEANANKYTWVWKKACITNRDKLFVKITDFLTDLNLDMVHFGVHFKVQEEYEITDIKNIMESFTKFFAVDKNKFVKGKGKQKPESQIRYEFLEKVLSKLYSYSEKIEICGEERNSYSKTDHDATFMRIKTDYMGNDQLLPAYNIQFGICDEFISVLDVNHFANDQSCFIPLMDKFYKQYGFYPTYPVADAGYGSLNNYDYCEKVGMEKYMKFPMFDKETKDKKYHNNPFRSANFKINQDGVLVCPNNKKFIKIADRKIKDNKYGRVEEIYQCESCEGCPFKDKCTKSKGNRKISLNRTLTKYHDEVINNLCSIHGALLLTNRSIQSEGTFGILKQDRGYRRIRRKGIVNVKFEFYLLAIGFNLRKYFTKTIDVEEELQK